MRSLRFIFAFSLLISLCLAAMTTQAGPYRVALTAKPGVIPVGQATLYLNITDAKGKPLDNLEVKVLAKMPGMDMGEREQRAVPVPGKPGSYSTRAAFAMAGAYDVTIKVAGPQGESTAHLSVQTGQDLAGTQTKTFNPATLVPWAVGLGLVLYVLYRVKGSGSQVRWREIFNRTTLGGLGLLAVMLAIAVYAVNTKRRAGSMTPLEAQGMEMNTPAPPGTLAVEVARVSRGPVSETIRYSGQAIGYTVQDVTPRGTGIITWMPYYVGDVVKKGEILARLDTSQLDPQLAERAAMANMAGQSVAVAATQYQAALAEVTQARAELSAKQGAEQEAEAMLDAAKQERESTKADLQVAQSDIDSAQAEVTSASAEEAYQQDELARSLQLFAKGALSRSELQQSQIALAKAKTELHHAQTLVIQAKSKAAAARANVRKGDSMVAAAMRRVQQARAGVRAAQAMISAKQSAADAAKQGIAKEQAGVAQARAGYASAAAQKGYASLKAELNGVITERIVGPGTLVNPGQAILRIAQVTPIRVQANIPLSDLGRVRVGQPARITLNGDSSVLVGTVRSVSPSVDPSSRTGIAEVLLANSDRRVLPGQFVSIEIRVGGTQEALSVPVAAVQHPPSASGEDKAFVWVAEPLGEPGRFSVRPASVKTGSTDGKSYEVKEGLTAGEWVVTTGAEALREGTEVTADVPKLAAAGPVIEVSASGFKPDVVTVDLGSAVTLTFIRRSEDGCGKEVVFPDLGIRKPLPLNEPVAITLNPAKSGELRFTCGMDMLKGKVVVR
jgi:RND family efflux transporter MFP subunit